MRRRLATLRANAAWLRLETGSPRVHVGSMDVTREAQITLDVTGMTCAACAGRVEKALRQVDGVVEVAVNLPLERADVRLSRPLPPTVLLDAVEAAGYHPMLRGFGSADRRQARERRHLLRRREQARARWLAALAVLAAIPFMIDMILAWTGGTGEHWLPGWVQALLATLVQVVCGARFYAGAWKALRSGAANMDVLVALGTTAAYGLSLFHLLTGRMHHGGGLYFEASVAIIAFVLIGKVLEGEAKSGATEALEALAGAAPRQALLVTEAGEREVSADTLGVGDRIAVRAGASVPADAVVREGHADFDEAMLTGESLPIAKSADDFIIAGSVATNGRVVAEVLAIGDDTRLQRIARLIEDAEISKSPSQQLADRISAMFVPAVLAIAMLSGLAWFLAGAEVDRAVLIAVSVLVVACPCALGLATPIALVAGANAAARAGLIVTDHQALEAAGRVTRVAFDKTGTLTQGTPDLAGFVSVDGSDDELLAIAAALAAQSDHVLDRALLREAGKRQMKPLAAEGLKVVPGRGLEAKIDGETVVMGNMAHMAASGVDEAAVRALLSSADLAESGSISLIARGGSLIGAIGFADRPRGEVGAALAALRGLGTGVTVLSGDRPEAVRAFAQTFGLDDARGGLMPEAKLRALAGLRQGGDVVAVVGDGINDAPVLRAADVGVAMGTGTDAAKAAAAVTLARPDPRLIASLLRAGRAARATIAQNLGFAFVFNGIGIPLAAAGLLSPALAGAAMALSSVSVVLNAWRLARRDFSPQI